MDGKLINNCILVLEEWLKEDHIIDSKTNFCVDRHIDTFYDKTNKATWIFDSFNIYKVVVAYLEKYYSDINVMLIFEITPSSKKKCIPLRLTNASFEGVITPPSICLYRGEWKDILYSDCRYLNRMSSYYNMNVYYLVEFDNIENCFWRTVYMF